MCCGNIFCLLFLLFLFLDAHAHTHTHMFVRYVQVDAKYLANLYVDDLPIYHYIGGLDNNKEELSIYVNQK